MVRKRPNRSNIAQGYNYALKPTAGVSLSHNCAASAGSGLARR